MGRIARSFARLFLFLGLFYVCFLYVHTYPYPLTSRQLDYLIAISEWFGVYDYEAFYIDAMIAIDLVVAVIAYILLMKIWRYYRSPPVGKSRD